MVRLRCCALVVTGVLAVGCTGGDSTSSATSTFPDDGTGLTAGDGLDVDDPSTSADEDASAALLPATIDECEPLPVLPCDVQVARFAVELPATDVQLVHIDRSYTATTVDQGLGGWSLSVVHSYDPQPQVLAQGDGGWRRVAAIPSSGDRLVVAADDGTEVYELDASGRHLRTFDAITGHVTLVVGWTEAGVATLDGASGRILTVGRSTSPGVVRLSTPAAAAVDIGLDEHGHVRQIVGADGSSTWITTASDGSIERVVQASGVTELSYDQDGRLASLRRDAQPTTRYARTDTGTSTQITTTVGDATIIDEMTIAEDGVVRRSHTDATGSVTTVEMRGAGRRVIAADGRATDFSLGGDPRWGLQSPVLLEVVTDGPDGHVVARESRTTATSDPDPAVSSDAVRRYASDLEEVTVEFSADADVTRVERSDGPPIEWQYDSSGQVVQRSITGLPTARWSYADDRSLTSYQLGDAADRRTWTFLTDAATSSTQIVGPDGTSSAITFDRSSRPIAITRNDEQPIRFRYDATGQPTVVDGSGDTRLTTIYGPNGLPTVEAVGVSGAPRMVTTSVDPQGRPTQLAWTDGVTVTVERDGLGRIVSIGDATQDYDQRFDELGRFAGIEGDGVVMATSWSGSTMTAWTWTGQVNGEVGWQLDEVGRAIAVTVDGSPLTLDRDPSGRLVGIGATELDLDAAGRVTAATTGVVSIRREYDVFGALIGIDAAVPTGTAFAESIVRDAGGRVIERFDRFATDSVSSVYTYDPSGRLAASTVDAGPVAGVTSFVYDADGNRTSMTAADGTTTFATFDEGDALLSADGNPWSYDSAGRLASITDDAGVATYRYDRGGSLQSVQLADGTTVEYIVDGLGHRVGRIVDGTLERGYLYGTGPGPIAELGSDGRVVSRIAYGPDGTTPLTVDVAGRTYVYVVDHLGSPRLLIAADTGEVVQQIDYDAWGRTLRDTNPGFQPLGFTGGLVDSLTGLVRLGQRDYDPATGRFTAPDPIGLGGGSVNLYTYAGNRPTTHRDPQGTCWACPSGGVVTVGFGGNATAVGGGSAGVQLAWGPDGVVIAPQVGVSKGFGLGFGVQLGWQERTDGLPPSIVDFKGPSKGQSQDVQIWYGNVGRDVSYDDAGNELYSGPHIGGGPKGGGATSTDQYTPDWLNFCFGSGCSKTPVPYQPPAPLHGPCSGPVLPCVDPANPCTGDNPPVPCDNPCPGGTNTGDQCEETPFDPNAPGSRGDPHLQTMAGLLYDFQAAGEFVLALRDDASLMVQVRQEPLVLEGSLAINTAVAASIGNRRVTVDAQRVDHPVFLDGVPFPIGRTDVDGGGTIERSPAALTVTWPDGTVLVVWVSSAHLDVTLSPADGSLPVRGLLGSPDGRADAVAARDGSVISAEELEDASMLYGRFGQSWLLTADESLFEYAPGRSSESYWIPDFPHVVVPPTEAALAAATDACRIAGVAPQLLAACAFDLASSGDLAFAESLVGARTWLANRVEPPEPTSETRGVITAGVPVRGAIDTPGLTHEFTFDVDAGDVAYFVPGEPCTSAGGLEWFVADDDGVRVTPNPYACTDLGRIEFDRAGTYRLAIASSSGGIGEYEVTWVQTTDVDHGALPVDRVVNASVASSGAVGTYHFTVASGDAWYFDALGTCDNSSAWRVLDATGQQVSDFPYACEDIGRVEFTSSGEYVLEVSSYLGSSGPYSFRVWQLPQDSIRPLAMGQWLTGEIDVPGARHRFPFRAAAGDTLQFTTGVEDCSTSLLSWHVLDATGRQISGDPYVCAHIGTVTFDAEADYVLEVSSYRGSTGTYRVRADPPG